MGTVDDFLKVSLTEEEFVESVIKTVVGLILLKAVTSRELAVTRKSKPFRLYDWCFRHIDYWNNRAQRKYIESLIDHATQHHRIMIPGIKLIRRPRKPK